MTLPRRSQISLSDTSYYHCIARCVRRAFLCGEDYYTGQNFEHRRAWLVERLQLQSKVFGVNICAYAIMSNHYHVVVHVDRKRVMEWSDEDVVDRWTTLFSAPPLIRLFREGGALSKAQRETVADIITVWRGRLCDLSWYMRCLNEYIARKANAEDECTGRFWEGRFKSQALLGEAALLSCMAYVDLNPVRAKLAATLTDSDYTSIQVRLREITLSTEEDSLRRDSALLPFSEGQRNANPGQALPFNLKDYIDMVDGTARVLRSGKRGVISKEAPRLVTQLGLSPEQWLDLTLNVQTLQLQAIGDINRLEKYSQSSQRCWIQGKSILSRVYAAA